MGRMPHLYGIGQGDSHRYDPIGATNSSMISISNTGSPKIPIAPTDRKKDSPRDSALATQIAPKAGTDRSKSSSNAGQLRWQQWLSPSVITSVERIHVRIAI